MRKILYFLMILASGWAAPVASQQQFVAGGMARGTVEAVYVRMAPGVFVETRILRVVAPAADTWSDIRIDGMDGSKPRNALAKNPAGLRPARGDEVQLVIAPSPELATGPTPEITRVVQRVAPAHSRYAQRFDADNPLPSITAQTRE